VHQYLVLDTNGKKEGEDSQLQGHDLFSSPCPLTLEIPGRTIAATLSGSETSF
jgi:hypothetical protein